MRLATWSLACMLAAMLPASANSESEWKLITDRDGIQVYRQLDAQSRFKTFRGVTRMRLPDEYAMLALYNDVDAFPRWLHLIDSATEMNRNGPLNRDLRFRINLMWPLKDREVLVNARQFMVITPQREYVTTILASRPSMGPKNDNYVRIPDLNGIFRLERVKPGIVEVTFQIRLTLGGYIPDWIVNLVMSDQPYFTLKKLRRIVSRKQYQKRYFSYLDLFGPGRPDRLPPPPSYIRGTLPPGAPAPYPPPGALQSRAGAG